MSRINKRSSSRGDPSSPSSPSRVKKHRHRHHHDPLGSRSQSDGPSAHQRHGKPAEFVSYLERPDLPPNLRVPCEIIATTPPSDVDKALDGANLTITQQEVEEILKLSYNHAAAAVKFFRWAGLQLSDGLGPYCWNLLVDLLGKNSLFDAMWDAIESMRTKKLLSLATFASVFGSYASAGCIRDAFAAFVRMEQYDCTKNVMALNSLLSAACRHGETIKADEFLRGIKDEVKPDSDSYAILLEGWETEGDVASARRTCTEMVAEVGWDPANAPAYDSCLCTLLKGPNGLREAIEFFSLLREKRCTPGYRFFKFALEECVRKKDARGASSLWAAMTTRNAIVRPNAQLYNLMISLHCELDKPDVALRFLDDMVYEGAFPDTYSYNVLLHSFIRCRQPKDTVMILSEMMKNECHPSHSSCAAAVRMCLDAGDPYGAIKCWKVMVEDYKRDLAETGNFLIKGLIDHKMVQEALTHAQDLTSRGIKLSSATHVKLEHGLDKAGKKSLYHKFKLSCLNK